MYATFYKLKNFKQRGIKSFYILFKKRDYREALLPLISSLYKNLYHELVHEMEDLHESNNLLRQFQSYY